VVRTVAFDESGNTGADLINRDQPTFALATCDFTKEEAEAILAPVIGGQIVEPKFKVLKRSRSGRAGIVKVLVDERLTPGRAKAFVFHKKYLALTKVVDLLVENLAHRDGVDLYRDGANIAISNLHYFCGPAFCGDGLFEEMLSAFVDVFRKRTAVEIKTFYERAWSVYEACSDTQYKVMLGPIIASAEIIDEVLANNGVTALDPAIPAFVSHGSIWGEQYNDRFKILHDKSKPIAHEKESLELLMGPGPFRKIGYDRRVFEFPLRAELLEFGDSAADRRLQVADILAGGCNHWARGMADEEYRDELWNELNELNVAKWLIGLVWPSPDVTPEDLDTAGGGGQNAVDAVAEHLSKA